MILVVDIGNSNVVVGVMRPDKNYRNAVQHQFRLQSDPHKTPDEYAMSILYLLRESGTDIAAIKSIMISSVVPSLTDVLVRAINKYFSTKPCVVDVNSDHGMSILIDHPNELGSDRLMSALAAYTMFKKDCITVDFGTATTFEVTTAAGEYKGGIIFPGVKLSAQALHKNTAKLPEVELAIPDKVVGTNTVSCIQSGLYYGYLELVDGLIDRIKKEAYGDNNDVMLLSTGGLGVLFSKNSRHKMQYEPSLIPYGLYFMYQRGIK